MRKLASLLGLGRSGKSGTDQLVGIPPHLLEVSESDGPLNQANLERLHKSFTAIGTVLAPIYVTSMGDGRYLVKIGRHRAKAAELAGLATVPCFILDDEDELMVELARIEENLTRNVLGPSDYARLVVEREQIYKALRDRSADHVSQSSTPSERTVGSYRDHAERTGEHKDKVHRAAKRGKALGPEILKKTRGTSLDKDVELDVLATLPPDAIEKLADRAAAGERVSARTPDGKPRERRIRNQIEPFARARDSFDKWLAENPWVEADALLRDLIAKIKTALSAGEPDKSHQA